MPKQDRKGPPYKILLTFIEECIITRKQTCCTKNWKTGGVIEEAKASNDGAKKAVKHRDTRNEIRDEGFKNDFIVLRKD